ncbi:hypothetical protein KIW84_012520 [Lathyrus oleraceus]|uniref:Uncharacterized protein n=1 Tax=Pisum sativum TaxID=3888 RepID=A0A9D5BHU1_PEA|nr:hypothetical protein KIW84_012520 [Pisum sativum]
MERSKFSVGEGVNAKVKFLKWNCGSDLLAGVVDCENYDAIKIWYFSNNHWYVKHEIRYLKQDEVRFIWNQEKPLQLICWTLGGQVTVYNFVWITAVMDNSVALVIDGSNINVTPLSLSLMPPPMYLFSLKFSSHVRGMAVYCKNSKNKLAALLSDGSLCVVELPSIETWEELEGKEFIVEASHTKMVFGSILHLVWLDSHKLLSVSHYGFSHSNDLFQTSLNKDALPGFFLQEIELECSEDIVPGLPTCSGWHATVSKQNNLKELVIGIAPNPASKSSAFMQFSEGKIKEYSSKMGTGGGSLEQEFQGFSAVCPRMGVALVRSVGQSKPVLFGLDEIGRLHTSGGIVNNPGYITEFVCSIKNENVLEKLYKNHVSLPCSEFANVMLAGALENCHVDNKVSSILMAIRKALQEHFTESPARETCYKANRKPKSTNSYNQNSRPATAPEAPPVSAEVPRQLQFVSSALDTKEATSKPQRKLENVRIPQHQHVILPNHIIVPDSEKNKFCFGTLGVNFGVDTTSYLQESINHLQTIINQFANEALRTLCLAYMELENGFSAEDTIPVTGFTYIGVIGIKDHVRPGVKEFVALCRSAGITVRMVTGDNIKPAKNQLATSAYTLNPTCVNSA